MLPASMSKQQPEFICANLDVSAISTFFSHVALFLKHLVKTSLGRTVLGDVLLLL